MGLFGKRKSREERGMDMIGQISEGKGFYGRMTKAFIGDTDFARIQKSLQSMQSGTIAAQLRASGAPTTRAVVTNLADTGQLINFDPVVDFALRIVDTGQELPMRTVVSKLQIPRIGDNVLLVADPQNPGGFLYAGPAEP